MSRKVVPLDAAQRLKQAVEAQLAKQGRLPNGERLLAQGEGWREGEVVRVTFDDHATTDQIKVRVWYTKEDGSLAPGRQGIHLPIAELPNLVAVLTLGVDGLVRHLGT